MASLSAMIDMLSLASDQGCMKIAFAETQPKVSMVSEIPDSSFTYKVGQRHKTLPTLVIQPQLSNLECHLQTWVAMPPFSFPRTGSSDEVALLIAEFGLLDREQAALLDAISAGRAALLDDDDLGHLAIDVPDLRNRLGIGSVHGLQIE